MSLASTLRLLPMVALASCALMTQKKAWPDYSGEFAVRGPTAEVTVTRDTLGVPHIRGNKETDGVYGLGFVHAQDRLFQADLTRRLMYGEASTLFGERAVELDGFVGGLEIRERAGEAVKEAPFEVQAILEAYCAGFNAGRDSLDKLPVEYVLLGVEEVPDWTPTDVVANAWLQSYNLADNPEQELAALELRTLKGEVLDKLLRMESETPELDDYWDELRGADIGEYTPGWDAWMGTFGGIENNDTAEASNNWIVGGDRTTSGKPIVANDPHLGQRVPSLWYPVDVEGGDLHVAGATFPGTPAVVIGHNEHVAWGLTNLMADYVDFVVLETRADGGSVVYFNRTVPLRKVDVEVEVLDGETVNRTVWWSPAGPVITERDRSHVVAMRWHALELEGEETTAFWKLNNAKTVEEALDAMDRPLIVAQNLVVADTEGDYAWQAVGSVPVRKAHTGRVPYPGGDKRQGWKGWYEELPGEWAPEKGWVMTANARPTTDTPATKPVDEPEAVEEAPEDGAEAPPTAPETAPVADGAAEAEEEDAGIDIHGIATGWAQRWRHGRLEDQLSSKDSWSPEAVAALQTDVYDLQAATLIPKLLEGVEGSTEDAKRCRTHLQSWDFQAEVDQIGPTVWATFQRELLREAIADDIGNDAFDIYLQVHSPARNLLSVNLEEWVDDIPDAVDTALTATCSRLEATLGEDENLWMWGDVHVLALEHPFSSSSSLLSKWNAPERRFPGAGTTVAAASTGWAEGEQRVRGMASLRIVMPLDDLSKSTFVHPGGNSGLPRHPNAFTHFDAFVNGETLPLWFSDADVAANAAETLTLVPGGGSASSEGKPAKKSEDSGSDGGMKVEYRDEPAPEEGAEAPTEGEEAPAEGEEAPAEGEEAPAEGEEAPAEGEEAPAEDGKTVTAERAPAPEPASEDEASTDEDGAP